MAQPNPTNNTPHPDSLDKAKGMPPEPGLIDPDRYSNQGETAPVPMPAMQQTSPLGKPDESKGAPGALGADGQPSVPGGAPVGSPIGSPGRY